MKPVLLHLYGPFAIQSYGLMIVIGLIITLYLLTQDKPLQKLISYDQFATLFQISFIAGLAGGRIWYLIPNWHTMNHWYEPFEIWNGGLSILGAIIGVLATIPWYLHKNKIPSLLLLDRLAIYALLLQSISRLGCFFAGCCHGIATNVPWAIIYHDPDSLAPLYQNLHPTQLYSAGLLFVSFLFLQWLAKKHTLKPGILLYLYIICISFERFIVDFWRGDQELLSHQGALSLFSIQQLLAILLFVGAMYMIVQITKHKKFYESI